MILGDIGGTTCLICGLYQLKCKVVALASEVQIINLRDLIGFWHCVFLNFRCTDLLFSPEYHRVIWCYWYNPISMRNEEKNLFTMNIRTCVSGYFIFAITIIKSRT